MEYLIYILIALFSTGGIVVVTVAYSIKYYSEIKILISDIARALGWAGKTVRKISVSSELEGTLNGVINDFNKNFADPILPHCKIQWVTGENHKNILRPNEAIICVSFDKKDHDLNYFNATYNFIKTALVAKTKPFLKKQTANAIDLVSTKLILQEYRREVLRTFNNKFNEVEPDTKEVFYRLEETEATGLFSTLLLPEFHYLGEVLNDKSPNPVIQHETEQFIQWFYDLATREIDEYTNLRFERTYLKVGVILVAKLSTYQQSGIEAYTKWAEKYAAENYNAVYILSKGAYRNKIAKEVADVLIESKGFDQVNKKSIFRKTGPDGTPLIITSICLRPNLTTIIYNAWEYIKKRFEEDQNVIGIIETVVPGSVIVNVSGLKVSIAADQLSKEKIPDASKLFKVDQELELKILEVDQSAELIRLSNVDTRTDPKKLIDANLSNDKPVPATVYKIQKDREQLDKGLMVRCTNPEMNVFIPRSKATFSHYTDLSKKYSINSDIQILLQNFSFDFGDYTGTVYGLVPPYESETYKNLKVGDEVEVTIREIQEKFLTCEIIEGLECRLYTYELSWDPAECNTDGYNIDQKLRVKVYKIDKEKGFIYTSQRQLTKSPQRAFYEDTKNKPVQATITKIDDNLGIYFKVNDGGQEGFVYWSEVDWGNVYPLSGSFNQNDVITVTPIEFDPSYNSINYSMKRVSPQQYEEFKNKFNLEDYVEGKVVKCYPSVCIVELNYAGLSVRGYIHKSKVSQCCYLNDGDIKKFLPVGSKFQFVVDEYHDKFQTVELCRKTFLKENQEVELGEPYSVKHVITHGKKSFFYSNGVEGYVMNNGKTLAEGKEIEVIPISTTSNEFEIAD